MGKELANNRRQPSARRYRRPRCFLMGLGLLLGLVSAVGCAPGSYPLDIFYEMHYQQSFKAHEPPRLSAPETAVGWFPPPKATSFRDDGQHLFEVNCSMCHGVTGQGDGPVLQRMMTVYGYQPLVTPNLTDPQVMVMGSLGIQGFMTSGLQVMPNFSKLLTEEEMRLTAEYVVNCLQKTRPQACP